jgi:hypothetical protein
VKYRGNPNVQRSSKKLTDMAINIVPPSMTRREGDLTSFLILLKVISLLFSGMLNVKPSLK